MNRAVVALAGMICSGAAPGGPPSGTWIRVASSNFELYTNAGERRGKEAVRHFEQVRTFFLKATGIATRSRFPVRIIAFRNDNDEAWRQAAKFLIAELMKENLVR